MLGPSATGRGPLRPAAGMGPDVPHDRQPAVPLSLIRSLIHPRTQASIGVHRRSLSRQEDHHGQPCAVILNPGKRKVGGSSRPLVSHQGSGPQPWRIEGRCPFRV